MTTPSVVIEQIAFGDRMLGHIKANLIDEDLSKIELVLTVPYNQNMATTIKLLVTRQFLRNALRMHESERA